MTSRLRQTNRRCWLEPREMVPNSDNHGIGFGRLWRQEEFCYQQNASACGRGRTPGHRGGDPAGGAVRWRHGPANFVDADAGKRAVAPSYAYCHALAQQRLLRQSSRSRLSYDGQMENEIAGELSMATHRLLFFRMIVLINFHAGTPAHACFGGSIQKRSLLCHPETPHPAGCGISG